MTFVLICTVRSELSPPECLYSGRRWKITMSQTLHCSNCDAALSLPLEHADGRHIKPPQQRDGEPLTERGSVYMSMNPLRYTESSVNQLPQAWMRLADLLGGVGYTSDRKKLSGCCGIAGTQGPNRVCVCGASVGTESSDCWTPRVFVPDPATTRWMAT